MTKTWIQQRTPQWNQEAYVEAGRCDGDGWYWCIRIDGGIHADGYAVTEEEAVSHCREELDVIHA